MLAVMVGLALPAGAEDQVTEENRDVKLKSVQFDLISEPQSSEADSPLAVQGAVRSAEYRSIVVADGGDVTLQPLGGAVRLTVAEDQLQTMTAERNGEQIGVAADGFVDLLADAASSVSVHSFVRLDGGESAQPVAINLFYDRPLDARDYLLIQEVGGDASIEVIAIDNDGVAVGNARQFGPGYQWNTGHGPALEPTAWASVLPAASLVEAGQPVIGVRITSSNAQIKAVALTTAPPEALPHSEGPAESTASAVDGAVDSGQAGVGVVGLESKIQPAIAVGGAGCADGPITDPAALVPGEAATFCFIATNLGGTNLTNLTISDELLGLVDAVLPRAAGSDVLKPGEQAVFYYHTVLEQRPVDAMSSVTATVIDGDGAAMAGVVAPSNSSSPGGVAPPAGSAPTAIPVVAPTSQTGAQETSPPDSATPQPGAATSRPVEGESAAPRAAAVTQLAMTGVTTEPWVLVIFAMACIFFGYTAYAAFKERTSASEPAGHEQLDSLGFD